MTTETNRDEERRRARQTPLPEGCEETRRCDVRHGGSPLGPFRGSVRGAARAKHRRWLFGAALATLTLCATAGCDEGASSTSTTTTASTTTTIDPGCIPADNDDAVADTCGVFVSSSQGKDTNSGTAKDQAFETIQKALDEAKGRPIYLCGETFGNSVEVTEGVQIYGGLDCTAGWAYAAEKRSRIEGEADVVALRVASGVSVELADVDVIAADAKLAGGSSIAVLAESDAEVVLSRCDLEAKAGAEGESPVPEGTGTPGPKGENGSEGCVRPLQQFGGPGGANLCDMDTVNVSGGFGGIGFAGDQGGDGTAGNSSEGLSLGGAGGTKQADGMPVIACVAGGDGAAALAGEPGGGAASSEPGGLDASGFTGAPGGDGKTGGAPGAGGGGGGGGKKCVNLNAGPGGGGGGAGGCGGAAGKGGRGGGASIGVVSVGATFTFIDVKITTGAGGNGGDGGAGQPGGAGGLGGMPGGGDGTGAACAGGKGGNGGPGGRGGGGRGGPSIGIAHTGEGPVIDVASITIGDAGEGGEGDGDTGNGAAGEAAPVMDFNGG